MWVVAIVAALCAVAHATPEPREPCAIVVVIDRAMGKDKLALVTEAVTSGLASLEPTDQVAVVAFSRTAQVVLPLQSVAKPAPITAAAARVRSGDGANLVAGLEAAFGILANLKHKAKRVIVLSDGNTVLGVQSIASKMRGAGIRVSAVGVQSLNHTALKTLASAGGGRKYVLEQPAQLAKVFAAARQPVKHELSQAVVFVIDRSGSMSGAKLESAKELVRVTAEMLVPKAQVAVVAFDSEAHVVVPFSPAANRMRFSTDVSRLVTGGGTNIYPGLKAAFEILVAVKADIKQVIILSDGEAPMDGIVDLVNDMRAAQISVSAVGVAGADRNTLSAISDAGDGRLYMVDNIAALPRIVLGQQIED